MIQWLSLCAPNAGGTGLIPGWRTKIPHSVWCNQKINKIQLILFLMTQDARGKTALQREDHQWSVRMVWVGVLALFLFTSVTLSTLLNLSSLQLPP